ncbi:MAG: M18 family aminopeptidase, partial [Lachnospiraceae bacterium]|nr:M18 family aminopeptidase [Lachnospiraceae bacterium]
MNIPENSRHLLSFIGKAPTSYHSVLAGIHELEAADFVPLTLSQPWQLQAGGSYYINVYGTSLFAFTIGNNPDGRLHIAAAHTDYPCIKVKPSPEMTGKHYARVNVTFYGGAILNTWLDRPLSVAGKVMTKSEDVFHPLSHIIDLKKPVFIIPNLAIHMNRSINEGLELNKQSDMLPLAAQVAEQLDKDHFFMQFLAEQIGVAPEDILDFDLTIYLPEEGCFVGLNNDFISSPRIDNQTSVVSCLHGLIHAATPESGINLISLFDNEEIGSSTKQGARSDILKLVIEKLYAALGVDTLTARDRMLSGFCLSLDVAHAIHPNKPDKCDPTNQPYLNGGIVLKLDAAQRYATDTE